MRRPVAATAAILALAGTGTLTRASASDGAAVDPAEQPNLVSMQDISVPIIDGDRLDGAFKVKVVLAAADSVAAGRISADMPRLRSTSLAAALEFSRLYASPMRAVDAEMLSQHLTQTLQQEEPGISHALIVEVAARPV